MHSPYPRRFLNLLQMLCPVSVSNLRVWSHRITEKVVPAGWRGNTGEGTRLAHTSPLGVAVPVPYNQTNKQAQADRPHAFRATVSSSHGLAQLGMPLTEL